jgi:hypothetical protein
MPLGLKFEAWEDIMSADSIHIIVTIGIVALMFSWVPFVNAICPPGFRSTKKAEEKQRKRRPSLMQYASPSPVNPPRRPCPVSSLSSRRLADQSRDLLHALSARDHAEPATAYTPRTAPEGSLSQKEIIKTCAE